MKTITQNTKRAGSDLNQLPPPCQGSVVSNELTNSGYAPSIEEGCPKSASPTNAIEVPNFWSSFRSYLTKNNNYLGARDRLNYALKYAHVLDTGDARQLLELNQEKRMHIMKSLSALAKYTGRYDRWQQIRQRYQIKWSNGDSFQAFSSIFNKEKDLDDMISWLKDTCSKIPQKYRDILMFNTLTGLRPSEAYPSIRLLHDNTRSYLNDDTKILEHFTLTSLDEPRRPIFLLRMIASWIYT